MSEPEREVAKCDASPGTPASADGFAAQTSSSHDEPARSCGSCTVCCTIMGVPELKKRPWEKCPHVAVGAGCTIYDKRPMGCRRFMCGWLLDTELGPELKPEVCHVLLYQRGEQHIVATCDPDFPDAWREPNVIDYLHRLAKAVAPARRVLLMEKDRLWYVTETAVVPSDTG